MYKCKEKTLVVEYSARSSKTPELNLVVCQLMLRNLMYIHVHGYKFEYDCVC